MWFELNGDERLKACASEGCGGQPTWRLEADGVGSNYCSGCKERIDKTETMGPEQQRLMDRLFNDPSRKLVNFNIYPGDKPATAEQICAEVNKAMDEIKRRREAGEASDEPPVSGRPRVNLRRLVDGL